MIKHRVGPLADLQDNIGVRVEIGDRIIAVFKTGQKVIAVGDTCPHMGASLAEGYLDGNTVICPWHGWVFDVDNGTSPFDEEARVPTYRVTVENGDVFVEIDATADNPGCPAATETPGS